VLNVPQRFGWIWNLLDPPERGAWKVYYLSRTNHDPIWTAHVEMKTLHIIYGLRMRGPRYGIKNSLKRGELSGHFRGGLRQSGSARQNKANIKPEVA